MREDYFCCLLSKVVYYNRQVIIDTITCRPYTKQNSALELCSSEPRVYESDIDAECLTVECKNKLFIAFRGTESIRDCLSDVNIIKVPMDLPGIYGKNGPEVHWGFLRQFRSLQKEIDDDIKKFLTNEANDQINLDKEIIFTGHSLGAAQATLATLQFKLTYPKTKISCYTFGSPRVGDKLFVTLFEKHINHYERIVNEEDPVTLIPFSWRFTHLPYMLYLDNKGTLKNRTIENKWKLFFKELWNYLINGSENPLNDHSCDDYLLKLEAINTKESINNKNNKK